MRYYSPFCFSSPIWIEKITTKTFFFPFSRSLFVSFNLFSIMLYYFSIFVSSHPRSYWMRETRHSFHSWILRSGKKGTLWILDNSRKKRGKREHKFWVLFNSVCTHTDISKSFKSSFVLDAWDLRRAFDNIIAFLLYFQRYKRSSGGFLVDLWLPLKLNCTAVLRSLILLGT